MLSNKKSKKYVLNKRSKDKMFLFDRKLHKIKCYKLITG